MVPLIKNVGEDDITAGILRGTLSLDELNSFFLLGTRTHSSHLKHIQLVGGFNPSEKYESQLG